MSYLIEKFAHRKEVVEAINLLESNNFTIDLGFGGELDGIVDNSTNEAITSNSIWNYPKQIQDAIFLLNEVN